MENEIFTSIDNAGKKIIRNIDLTLNLSIIQSAYFRLHKDYLNLIDLLFDLVTEYQPFANEKNITLQFKTVETEAFVCVEKYSVYHIFQYLLDNAVKHSNADKIVVKLLKMDDTYTVEVNDNGIGISDQKIAILFSSRAQNIPINSGCIGKGLGFILIKNFVSQNYLILKVNSKEKKGTTFSLTF